MLPRAVAPAWFDYQASFMACAKKLEALTDAMLVLQGGTSAAHAHTCSNGLKMLSWCWHWRRSTRRNGEFDHGHDQQVAGGGFVSPITGR